MYKKNVFIYTNLLLVSLFIVSVFKQCLALQVDNVSFKTIKRVGDTAIGDTIAIYQDSKGYLWFATSSGLLRYDGYEITRFHHHFSQPESLSNNLIRGFYEDEEGMIWLPTSYGLNRFDPRTEKFTRFNNHQNHQTPRANTFRDMIYVDNKGLLLATPGHGVFWFDLKTKTFSPQNYPIDGRFGERQRFVSTIYHDSKGHIWLGFNKGGAVRLNHEFSEPVYFSSLEDEQHQIDHNYVRSITEDSGGTIWLGTAAGLFAVNEQGHISQRFGKQNGLKAGLKNLNIFDVYEDTKGGLWLATDKGGLSYLHQDRQRISSFKHEQLNSRSIGSNVVRTVFEDAHGDIWAGLYPSGVSVFHRSFEHVSLLKQGSPLSHSSVLALLETQDRYLWLGTDGGGLNKIDQKTGEVSVYSKEEHGLCGDAVLSLAKGKGFNIWIGTWGGSLCKFNTQTEVFTYYRSIAEDPTTPSSANIWSLSLDKYDRLWIATQGGGINYLDLNSNKVQRILRDSGDPAFRSDNVWRVFLDSQDNIWTKSGSNGLTKIATSDLSSSFVSAIDSKDSLATTVICIEEDEQGRIWYGEREGVFLYDPKQEKYRNMSEPLGLVGKTVNSLLSHAGGMWIGTDRGLFHYDYMSKKTRRFDKKYWGNFRFNQNSFLLHHDGRLSLGGVNGVVQFDPKQLKDNDYIPPIVITGMSLFDQKQAIAKRESILDVAPFAKKQIVLNHKQNMFSLSYAALNFESVENNRYQYRLLGFDERWNKVGKQRKATFTNLNAGLYQFQVIGSNNDDVWNKDGAILNIKVLPPPWQTWWAYSIYCLLGLFFIAHIIYRQTLKRRYLQQQAKQLEEMVTERTIQLKNKNRDLQSVLSNMKQGLFTIDVNGEIEKEYSSHLYEIFCQKNIQGIDALGLLFSDSLVDDENIALMQAALDSSLGMDATNFEFNCYLLVNQYSKTVSGKTKYLDLLWCPIVVNDITKSIMVVVRDRTDLKEVEIQSAENQRLLEIIGHLLNTSSEKTSRFFKYTGHIIETAFNTPITEDKSPYISTVQRNIHTIKGNARTLGFSHISAKAHELETFFDDLKQDLTLFDSRGGSTAFEQLSKVFEEYKSVYYDVLGRNEIESTATTLASDIGTNTDTTDSFDSENNITFSALLSENNDALQFTAKQLNKTPPVLSITGGDAFAEPDWRESLTSIFNHVFSNCLDHGIEPSNERALAGKKDQGLIEVVISRTTPTLVITIKDDGKGINLNALYKRGIEQGKWSEGDKITSDDLAQIIFYQGISTKKGVSIVSGRGIGMDAVSNMVIALGGKIEIVLPEKSADTSQAYLPFELRITLPYEKR